MFLLQIFFLYYTGGHSNPNHVHLQEGVLILTVFTSRLSDASIPKSYAENYVLDEIKYTSEDTFSFKLEDLNGKVHRFQSGE